VLVTQDYKKHEIVFPLFWGQRWLMGLDTPRQDSVAFKFHL